MQSLTRFLREKLKLTVNRLKSAVERPWKRKFLGLSLRAEQESRVRVAPQSVDLEELKPLLRGWAGCFSVAHTRNAFEELDQWFRRKLRCIEWRKRKRGRTRRKRLIALGTGRECGPSQCLQWPRPVVERRSVAYERRAADRLFSAEWVDPVE